ncbi:ABC transporter ATP-binding protein [Actinocrispum wychmicini]|uniref:Peptide/nickel transport system ATP-binding protein n=1 Tax=Actinocrispum wychmicini TaxID=1213861 RepID=A0A4R2JKZ1_9PSEU|nr:ABC transporter ATP-binding protein [Actinocrispum wychmicini]TCO54845.1 peptide/nickel transport system ATP-binding protein [Actinocrispum wychmicini]
MTPLMSVDGLTVRFRTEDGPVLAVDTASFTVAEREVLALVGESGCGKSVTAMALTGLLPANAEVRGSVRLTGRELLGLSENRLSSVRGKEIAYVFQEPMTSLNPVMTVGRQIREVLYRHQRMARAGARKRALELFEQVGIPEPHRRLREYPHQLSGGMRQRVMIAMALACRPTLLVADEPTTALDVTIQADILDLLRTLSAETGTAVLLITHDLGVVADIADRVVVMYAGRIIEESKVDSLFATPSHPYTRGLLDAVPNPARRADGGLREIPGLVPVLRSAEDVCTFADRCGHVQERCRASRPTLAPGPVGHPVACWYPLGGRVDERTGLSGARTGTG